MAVNPTGDDLKRDIEKMYPQEDLEKQLEEEQTARRVVERKLLESEAARLKAEGERDEARVPCKGCAGKDTAKASNALCYNCRNKPYWELEAAEARLRAVIEAANRVLTTLEPHFSPGDERQRDAILTYRRVRDAQASPEPFARIDAAIARIEKQREEIEALKRASPEPEASHKFEPIIGSLTSCCAVCTLPWSKHGGRDGE